MEGEQRSPGEIVCTGPKYQYSYATDTAHVHLRAQEYERLGEKTAQVYFERVVAGARLAAAAAAVRRARRQQVTVHFHVPVPPLVWDDLLPPPHGTMIPQWEMGRGFEVLARAPARPSTRSRSSATTRSRSPAEAI